jgi:hypothetical protein
MSGRPCLCVLYDLQLKLYIIRVLQELWLLDKERPVACGGWLFNMAARGFVDPFIFFSTDKAWFHMSNYVSTQNTLYWSSENACVPTEMIP